MRIEIPPRLRALVRARESSLILLAALVGALGGLVVATMSAAVDVLHEVLFKLPPGQRLSESATVDPVRALSIPCIGGLLLGVLMALIARRRRRREVDPIEANALHGGRMSLRDSVVVAAQTVWSSGVGASVGLEAGYTQLASGIASWLGRAFRLRRGDLRILVGCGAAGGIAGAFGAPLAGAFYAFELIIGRYSVTSLAPIGVSALIGYFVAKEFAASPEGIFVMSVAPVLLRDLIIAAGLGLVAAGVGMLLMRGVAGCEVLLLRLKVKPALRPALGGIVVGLLALGSPQILSSGHGALHLAGVMDRPLRDIALVFVLKALASIVSIGSGFRGGMFFASLLLGALGGRLAAAALEAVWPSLVLDPNVYLIIGMAALSASVIGGPLTMVFIALETPGDLWLTAAVFIAAIVAGHVTREMFGYSFATWRFHLRGETIRSAADVGWMRDLTVARMMRRGVPTALVETPVPAFCETFPLGSAKDVAAVDKEGRYVGLVNVAEAHAAEAASGSLRDIVHHGADVLLPEMNIRQAVMAFDQAEAEALAVVDSRSDRHVVGLLSESHALRRYSEELESRRREVFREE